MNFGFAWPLCFLLFVPLAFAAWRMLRRGRRAGIKFAPVRRLPAKTAGWRARVANLAPWLFLAGAVSLVVAAARPRTSLAHGSRSVDAIAIAMTVDVSGSMEALDFTPRGARTEKTRLVLHVLKGVQVPSVSFDANGRPVDQDETLTAIGDGLATAIARVKDADMKSKIVILLSDGVSNTGAVEPDAAAAAAAKLGIRVYTIGVGTRSNRTPFRVRDMFGRSAIQYADMSFDESQLKSIASKTGARYFGVRDEGGLKAALEEIDSLEKTTLDRTAYQRWNEYFPWFLVPGAALLLLAVSLQMFASRRLV